MLALISQLKKQKYSQNNDIRHLLNIYLIDIIDQSGNYFFSHSANGFG